MKIFLSVIFLFSFTAKSEVDQDIDFLENWEKLRNFACADDKRYRASRKFNRIATLIDSLEMGPPTPSGDCNQGERDEIANYDIKVPTSLKDKIQFAKDIFIQSRVNAGIQMAYFYYRIYDEEKPNQPENKKLERISYHAMSEVYGGYDQEVRERILKEIDKFISLLKEKKVPREAPKEHAKVFNQKVEKWNEILKGKKSNMWELFEEHYLPYKRQFHQDLAQDTGLLFLTNSIEKRVGKDLLAKDSAICSKPMYQRKSGIPYVEEEIKCMYPYRRPRVREDDIVKAVRELEGRFWQEKKDADRPLEIENKLKYSKSINQAELENDLNDYLADMLVYSPRTFTQVISKNPDMLKYICPSFEFAFDREGSEYVEMKIKNGIEFFGPASMWILAAGIMPFTRQQGFLTGHKFAIKGVMGVTALDLIWRGKNIAKLNKELERYENQIIGGNSDKFAFEEYNRLKQQYFDDQKGMVLVGTYEVLSLLAIGRLAKIVAKTNIGTYLKKGFEVDEIFEFAGKNKRLQSYLGKFGIKDKESFVNFLKTAPEKERIKVAEKLIDTSFGWGTLLTGSVVSKELADTVYFMYGFPYAPQGISALN